MFSIDRALLPSLVTRKALLILDAQNDFLAEDGALPVRMPIDLPQRLSDLANDFRRNGGEIIWVQSQFESSRPVADEQILIADNPNPLVGPAPVRSRRSRTAPSAIAPALSPEAFLTLDTGKDPHCVRPGAPGAEMHPIVRQAVAPNDRVLVKTFYSAFRVDELLRLLRVKFVTELFICGSSTSTGVMATAIEAASYGYTITIVEDCCGSQSMSRHRTAIRQVASTTGCDVLPAASVLGMIKTKPTTPERAGHSRIAAGGRSPTVRLQRGKKDAVAPSASAILSSIERLSLSDNPAANDEHAPEIIAEKQPQQPRRQQPAPLQPMAGPDQSQIKENTDRDAVVATDTPPSATQAQTPVSPRRSSAELSDDGHFEPQSSGEAVCAYSLTRGPTSSNSRSQRSTPPPESSSVEITPTADNNGCDPKSPEILANPTVANANIHPSPREPSTSTATDELERSNTGMASHDSDPSEIELCEGDTKVVYNVLPKPLANNIFDRIKSEVNWQRMSHQGGEVPRLVAVQGQVEEDGSKPIYRHPADESPPLLPFSPTVDEIRRVVEAKLQHPLNHVLIQLYRHGNDYISEHSDKTLDIVRGSFIANVSLGAERTMTLRTKRPPRSTSSDSTENDPKPVAASAVGVKRSVQKAKLPHNSLFQMGLETNMRWMHAIRQDKRLASDKSAAELAYDGVRISLTFRRIGTFLDGDEKQVWGQGATGKTKDTAHDVINGQTPEAVRMLRAFGRENQSTEFDWHAHYGSGFDVLHITAAPRLFLSADPVVNMRVQIMLAELGIGYARGSMADQKSAATSTTSATEAISSAIKFIDTDDGKTTVEGQRDIMLYLQKTYGAPSTVSDSSLDQFEKGLALLDAWRASSDLAPLASWETDSSDEGFLSGPEALGLSDFAVWPVLHHAFSALDNNKVEGDGKEDEEVPKLRAYYSRIRARDAVEKMLAAGRS